MADTPSFSSGLDGKLLYSTEVFPVETSPSQPITVEGGGLNKSAFVSFNGGPNVSHSQPVQYTIILADPQQNQNQQGLLGTSTTSAIVSPAKAPNILLSIPTHQQQQQYQHLQKSHHQQQNLHSGVALTHDVPAQNDPVPTQSAAPSLIITTPVLTNNKLDGALLNTSSSNNNVINSALASEATHPLSLSTSYSGALLLNNTNETVSKSSNANDKHIKEHIKLQQNQQQQVAPSSTILGDVVGLNSSQLRLVELPEAARGLGSTSAGLVLLTYAPTGVDDYKNSTPAILTNLGRVHSINICDSETLSVVSQPSVFSTNPADKLSRNNLKSSPAVFSPDFKGGAKLAGIAESSLGQKNNLNNHIRVLSAVAQESSGNTIHADDSVPSLVKGNARTEAEVFTGERGVWTSLVPVSSSLTSQPSLVLTSHRHHHQTLSTPPSSPRPAQWQYITQKHQESPHSADAACNGAPPSGMHSGRAGQTGSGQQAHSSNTTNTSTANNISITHDRLSPPIDRGSGNPLNANPVSTSSTPQHLIPPHTSLGMLSAGPPTIPAGIFRTGGDSTSASRLPSGSSSTTYGAAPYSSVYGGLHQQGGQSPGAHAHPHLQGLSHYHPFFPESAAAGALHNFGHSTLMAPSVSTSSVGAATTGTGHPYPRIESYSAVLASMGSQALQASSGPTLERSIRGPISGIALPPVPGRGFGSYLPSSAPGSGGSFHASLPSASSTSSPPSTGHRHLPGGSTSPSLGHGTPHKNNGGGAAISGSRLSPLDKMAALKVGVTGMGRDNSSKHSFDSSEDRANRPSPPSGHGPKVSFDSVVKEYGSAVGGGGRDTPPTPGYLRTSLSGKEGSLKHRILTRPSDCDPLGSEESPGSDRERRPSQQHGVFRDEPASKRAKYSSSSSSLSPNSPSLSTGPQPFHSREDSTRVSSGSSRSGHLLHHITSHNQHHSILSGTTTDHSSSGAYHGGAISSQAGTSHLPLLPHTHYAQQQQQHLRQQQQSSQYQQQRYHGQPQDDISGNNNTTTINKNTRDSNSSIHHQSHSVYDRSSSPSLAQPSSNSSPTHDLPAGSHSSPATLNTSSSHLQYPQHFMKGSIIQLADGSLKRVEELQTEDFVSSAQVSSDLKVDSSTVVRIEEHQDRGTAMLSFSVGEHRVQVTVEATLEHPFFVFGQGWSSCSVTRTLARYGLDCQKLNVGDVCISLTHKDVSLKAAEISQQQQQQQEEHQGIGAQHNNGNNKLKQWNIKANVDSVGRTVPSSSTPPSTGPLCSLSSSSPSSSPSLTSKPSMAMSPLKIDTKGSTGDDLLPPPSSSPSSVTNNKRLQQQELPPPMSNFVPVKKESSTVVRDQYHHHHHHSRKRSGASSGGGVTLHRPSSDFPVDCKEETKGEVGECANRSDDSSESVSRKRRWSAPDPVVVKAEKERERERQQLADQAQRLEERDELSSANPRNVDAAGSVNYLGSSSPSSPSSSTGAK
ncbi:ataxin-1 [Plakobranchus ocellatus]|uniref:Ataxin-1 n=1 Tax=Plakobranchus ocellatus TaxID=259542 RepID=A0AAV3ZC82_9GAST|nr:ataxin-1 [Plakobranchus ocellatus]